MKSVPAKNRKKKILIITHAFPPMNATASHRPYSWAKTWESLGHEVHVLTTAKYPFDGSMDLNCDLTGLNLNIVPYLRNKKKILNTNFQFQEQEIGDWERLKTITRRFRFGLGMFADLRMLAYRPLIKIGSEIIRKNKIEAIISTYPPEVVHFASYRLSEKHKIPWIADYRDLWFQEGRLFQFQITTAIGDIINRRLLRKAKLISTISMGLEKKLRSILHRGIVVSYNGYIEHQSKPNIHLPLRDNRVHVVYTGRLYPKKRDPEMLLSSLAQLRDSYPEIEQRICIDFYGHADPNLKSMIDKYRINKCVKMHKFVPYDESLLIQQHADILLFLDWLEKGIEGILTGKLFEYLTSGRPIICVGNRNNTEAAKIIEACKCGITLSTVEELKIFLKNLTIQIPQTTPDDQKIRFYSRDHQAKILLEKITDLI